jgi:hypothetical protein
MVSDVSSRESLGDARIELGDAEVLVGDTPLWGAWALKYAEMPPGNIRVSVLSRNVDDKWGQGPTVRGLVAWVEAVKLLERLSRWSDYSWDSADLQVPSSSSHAYVQPQPLHTP